MNHNPHTNAKRRHVCGRSFSFLHCSHTWVKKHQSQFRETCQNAALAYPQTSHLGLKPQMLLLLEFTRGRKAKQLWMPGMNEVPPIMNSVATITRIMLTLTPTPAHFCYMWLCVLFETNIFSCNCLVNMKFYRQIRKWKRKKLKILYLETEGSRHVLESNESTTLCPNTVFKLLLSKCCPLFFLGLEIKKKSSHF